MKKLLLFALITLSSMSYGQDLLTAGGFEGLPAGDLTTVSSPWSASGLNFPTVAIDALNARAGTTSLILPDKYSPLRQHFTAIPGITYTLTLYARFDNPIKAPSSDGIYVRIYDGSVSDPDGAAFAPTYSFYIIPTTLADGYIKYTYTFTAPQASLVLNIFKIDRLLNDKNSTIMTPVHMDDFSIKEGVPSELTVNGSAPYSYPYQVGVRQSPTFSSLLTVSYSYRGGTISGAQTFAPINAGSYIAMANIKYPTVAEGFAFVASAFTITRINQTITPTIGTYVYNGNPQGPTTVKTTANTTTAPNTLGTLTYSYVGASGTDYPASATPPAGGGSYTATATVAQTTNYNEGTSAPTPFTISKATPTVVPIVGTYTYTGAPQGPDAVTTASTGVVTYSYAGVSGTDYPASATAPANAGSYNVMAMIATDTNYVAVTSAAASFIINKAIPTATFEVVNSPIIYNGAPQSALIGNIISSVDLGSINDISIGGAASQTDAGSYAVTASFVPKDNVNYSTVTGIIAGNFVIDKATPTVTLTVANSPAVYTGMDQSAILNIASSSVAGMVTNIVVAGTASQTAVGSYEVLASFVPTDTANYNILTGIVVGQFEIGLATPVVTPVVGTYFYDGNPQGPTASTNTGTGNTYTYSYEGVGIVYGPSSTPPIEAGFYTVTATVAADGNYGVASSTATAFEIILLLKVKESTFNENNVKMFINNGVLYVSSTAKSIKTIEVYDLQGRLIANQKNVQSNEASISNLKASRQLLIVKVSGEDNAIVSKKVLNK
ncbi:T9SS sorting signal type C domain-containing protein [Flavobacterium sp.]|uniref:T9SS sorting signal type C domain-containing protein n=1 Tax=Flavobacterium sp. TaxID=239 RepID=UPI00286DCF87|nr:T9SS sorting signal type C domain-containing protein [Flavobacterium sp.]